MTNHDVTIEYRQATEHDLPLILKLQQENLPKNISQEEAVKQGFVTVEHDLSLLREMNTPYGHTVAIAKSQPQKASSPEFSCGNDNEAGYGHGTATTNSNKKQKPNSDSCELVGYALTMTKEFRHRLPILIPMFDFIDKITFPDGNNNNGGNSRLLRDESYVVMGQVCVSKSYRGQGVFKGLYDEMKRRLAPHFTTIITEISTKNTRSLRAHEKVGFIELDRYIQGEDQEDQEKDTEEEEDTTKSTSSTAPTEATTTTTASESDDRGSGIGTCWVVVGLRTSS